MILIMRKLSKIQIKELD